MRVFLSTLILSIKLRHIHPINIFCVSVLSVGIFIQGKVFLKNLTHCKDKSSKNLFDGLRLNRPRYLMLHVLNDE